MSWRHERATTKAEERRLADRVLLDEALAPYLRDHREASPDETIRLDEPTVDVIEPTVVTVRVAEGRTIDLRRLPSRAAVVRLHRRPSVALLG